MVKAAADSSKISSFFNIYVPDKDGDKTQVRVYKNGGPISYIAISILQHKLISINEYRGLIAKGGLELLAEGDYEKGTKVLSEIKKLDKTETGRNQITNLYNQVLKGVIGLKGVYEALTKNEGPVPDSPSPAEVTPEHTETQLSEAQVELRNKHIERFRNLSGSLSPKEGWNNLKSKLDSATQLYYEIEKENIPQNKEMLESLKKESSDAINQLLDAEPSPDALKTQIAILENADMYEPFIKKEDAQRVVNKTLSAIAEKAITELKVNDDFINSDTFKDWEQAESIINQKVINQRDSLIKDLIEEKDRSSAKVKEAVFEKTMIEVDKWEGDQQTKLQAVLQRMDNTPLYDVAFRKALIDLREAMLNVPDIKPDIFDSMTLEEQKHTPDEVFKAMLGSLGIKEQLSRLQEGRDNFVAIMGSEEIQEIYDRYEKQNEIIKEGFEEISYQNMKTLQQLEESIASLPQQIEIMTKEITDLEKRKGPLERVRNQLPEEIKVAEQEFLKAQRLLVISKNRLVEIETKIKQYKIDNNLERLKVAPQFLAKWRSTVSNAQLVLENAKELVKRKQEAVKNNIVELTNVNEQLDKKKIELKALQNENNNKPELLKAMQEAQRASDEVKSELGEKLRMPIQEAIKEIVDARIELNIREYARGKNVTVKGLEEYILEGKKELIEKYVNTLFKRLDQGDEWNEILNLKEIIESAVNAKLLPPE